MTDSEKIVVDASVAVKWYVPEEGSDEASSILVEDVERLAPDLLASEFGNVLWKKVGRGELTSGEATEICDAFLTSSPVRLVPSASYLGPALEIALRWGCTVYDALYLAVALGEDCGLATADARLAETAGGHLHVHFAASKTG